MANFPAAKPNLSHIRPSAHSLPLLMLGLLTPCTQADTSPQGLFDLSLEQLMTVKVSVASLQEESTLEAPASVSKVTRQDWNRNGARRLSDALEAVPSVVSHETWGGAETLSIRGYSTEVAGVRGLASSLDGVPLNTFTFATSAYTLPNVSLRTLEQVEMIRGPGSTLYGTDAFHGVVAMQTRSSQSELHEVEAQGGFPDYAEGSLFRSTRQGSVRSNFGFSYQKQGEQNLAYDYTSPSDGSPQQSERDNIYRNVSGFASWQWGDQARIGKWKFSTYLNDYQAQDFSGIGTQFFQPLGAAFELQSLSLAQDRDLSASDARLALGQLQHQVSLGDGLSLENRVYHWHAMHDWRFDNSRYPTQMRLRSNGNTLPCRTGPRAGTTGLHCPHELSQLYEENRTGVQSTVRAQQWLSQTTLVGGLGWDHQKVLNAYFERITADGVYLAKQAQGYSGKSRELTYAFFQGKSWLIEDEIALHYGVRHDEYSDGNSHTSPRAGVVWHLDPIWTSKWLYGQAFRAPSANELYITPGSPALGNRDIKPETIDTIEWINIYHRGAFQHELVLFASRWKDGITLEPVSPGSALNIYRNTGDNESRGIELRSAWQYQEWRLSSALSYTDSTNTTTDQDYVAFPNWGATLEVNYQVAGQALELALKQRILLDYADSDQLGNSDYPRSNEYYRTDFSVTKKLQHHKDAPEVFAHFYNIFDRDNTLPALYNAEGGILDEGFRFAIGARWLW